MTADQEHISMTSSVALLKRGDLEHYRTRITTESGIPRCGGIIHAFPSSPTQNSSELGYQIIIQEEFLIDLIEVAKPHDEEEIEDEKEHPFPRQQRQGSSPPRTGAGSDGTSIHPPQHGKAREGSEEWMQEHRFEKLCDGNLKVRMELHCEVN